MKVLYLGFISPDEEFDKILQSDKRMPVQTQRFGWNLLRAICSSGAAVDAITVAPASDFPMNSKVLFRRLPFSQHGVSGCMAGFVNVVGVKHWTRARAMDIELMRRYRRGGDLPDVVVVHGVNSAVLGAGRRIARKWGVPSVVVLTDPPHGMATRSSLPKSLPRRLNYSSVIRELDSYDGAISLTADLAHEFLPRRPFVLVEGFADAAGAGATSMQEGLGATADVVYAGGVEEDYGVLALLQAVEESAGTWTLGVCGRGSATGRVELAAASNPRIRYLGLLSQAELLSVYASSRVLINPRPVLPFTRLSFPSKLLEYLAHGKVVTSTRLPGIPPEYWDHLVELPQDPRGMAHVLDSVTQWDDTMVRTRQERALGFLADSKSVEPQGRRIADFLAALVDGPRDGASA